MVAHAKEKSSAHPHDEPNSRSRILSVTASLLQDQGYHATGLNQIISESNSPKGSLYYYFPGGKEELVAEAVRMSAEATLEKLDACFTATSDLLEGLSHFLEGSVRTLLQTDYKKGCPIASVGLEAAPNSAPIQAVCAEFFQSVESRLTRRLEKEGFPGERARMLANLIFCGFEGALIASRIRRDVTPLRVYQASISALVISELKQLKPR